MEYIKRTDITIDNDILLDDGFRTPKLNLIPLSSRWGMSAINVQMSLYSTRNLITYKNSNVL